MSSETYLDNRYQEGVWFTELSNDFVVLEESEDSVEVRDNQSGELLFEIDGEDWLETESEYFYRVPDYAVDNPVSVVESEIGISLTEVLQKHSGEAQQNALALFYARDQVEVSEK